MDGFCICMSRVSRVFPTINAKVELYCNKHVKSTLLIMNFTPSVLYWSFTLEAISPSSMSLCIHTSWPLSFHLQSVCCFGKTQCNSLLFEKHIGGIVHNAAVSCQGTLFIAE